MIEIPQNSLLVADGDFIMSTARHRGRSVSIEISGVFDGATVTPGYVTADGLAFVADVDESNNTSPKTEVGRWITTLPYSGKVGVNVNGSGANTSLLIVITDLLPR